MGRLTLGGSVCELSKDAVFCCDYVDFIYFHLMSVLQFFTLLGFCKTKKGNTYIWMCNTLTHAQVFVYIDKMK